MEADTWRRRNCVVDTDHTNMQTMEFWKYEILDPCPGPYSHNGLVEHEEWWLQQGYEQESFARSFGLLVCSATKG